MSIQSMQNIARPICFAAMTAGYIWSAFVIQHISYLIKFGTMQTYFLTWLLFASLNFPFLKNALQKMFNDRVTVIIFECCLVLEIMITLLYWIYVTFIEESFIISQNHSSSYLYYNHYTHLVPLLVLCVELLFQQAKLEQAKNYLFRFSSVIFFYNVIHTYQFGPVYKVLTYRDIISVFSALFIAFTLQCSYYLAVNLRRLKYRAKKGEPNNQIQKIVQQAQELENQV